MQVIMLTSVACENANYSQNQVYDVSEKVAKKWVERGLAKKFDEPKPTPIRNATLPRR